MVKTDYNIAKNSVFMIFYDIIFLNTLKNLENNDKNWKTRRLHEFLETPGKIGRVGMSESSSKYLLI
jgi:hypothetical protein